jgi:hypothetical protein
MRLPSSPSTTLQNIRQPSTTLNKDSLVFTYPIIFDDKLRSYAEVIRDFFTVQFITQIKISNILDLHTAASKSNYIEVNNREINPAEELAKNLGSLTRNYVTYQDRQPIEQSRYGPNDKYEYQNKINQLKAFIQDQIKNNPNYKSLNPIISTITIENLVDIPLVIGTKQYFTSSTALFWILFISAGFAPERESNPLTLDSANNLKAIISIMNKVTIDDYMKYFGTAEGEKTFNSGKPNYDERVPSNRVAMLLDRAESELDVTVKYLDRVLDPKKFADEVNIKTDNSLVVQVSTVFNNSIVAKNTIIQKCNTLFDGLLANHIAPLFNSVANALVSSDEINVSDTISERIKNISDLTNDLFENIFNAVLTASTGGSTNIKAEDEVKALQSKLDSNSNICDIVPRIAVENILRQLEQTHFGLVGMSMNKFANFVDKVVTLSTQLSSQNALLEKFIYKIAIKESRLTDVLEKYKEGILNFLFNQVSMNDPNKNTINNAGIFDIFSRPVDQNDDQKLQDVAFGTRIRQLLGGNDPKKELLENLSSALTNIIYFISLYCFLAYICEYFKSVSEELKIQKRDALEFPNYCLVLRASVIEKLFMSLSSLGFSRQNQVYKSNIANRGKAEEDQTKEKNPLQTFKLNEKHLNNMIRLVNDRLNVPNIIVVDEKSKMVYYKFMFDTPTSVGMLSLDNMKTYISHQKDIFQVF